MTYNKWDAAIVALGPIVAGACLSLGHGNTIETTVRVPEVFVLAAAITLSALYIGAALLGIAPPARKMASGVFASFRSASVLWLGFAPAIAFMVATGSEDQSMGLLGKAVVLIGGLMALRALYLAAFDECASRFKAVALYSAWTLVSLGIGGHLYVTQ
jgi:hypothetical protein